MRLLLDTHVLLWWLADDPALGKLEAPEDLALLSSDPRLSSYAVAVLPAS